MSVTFPKLKRILRPRPSTRIRIFLNPQLFHWGFGFRHYLSDESGMRIRNFFNPLSRVEIFGIRYGSGIVWTPLNPDIYIFFISWHNSSFPCAEYSRWCLAQCYRFFTSRTTVSRIITCRPYDLTMITVQFNSIETLRLRFFGISSEPQTSRSHVIRALPSGLRFEVHVCTARPRPRGKWFTVRFFAP